MYAQDMPIERALLCAAVVAVRAGVGPLPRVRPHVPIQIRGAREHATADRALGLLGDVFLEGCRIAGFEDRRR